MQLADDARRIPYEAYTDASIFDAEQTRVFEGRTWNYLGLQAEIPKPGDFKLTVDATNQQYVKAGE